MIDANQYSARPAPLAVFDALPEWDKRIRFYAPEPITWGDFGRRIRELGSHLIELGAAPGDRIAIYGHNSVDWAAASLAIQSIGCVLVPIYPASTPKQLEYILEHSEAFALFDHEGLRLMPHQSDAPISWSEAGRRSAELDARFDERLAALSLDDTGLMLYTSGTTGAPKGVPLTHGNVAHNAIDWLHCNAPLLHEDAVDLLWLPMSHIFGFGEMCLGNTLGFTTHLATPQTVLEMLPSVRPTVFMSVPAYWEKLAGLARMEAEPVEALRRLSGGRLQFCLSGGAGLKQEVKEMYLEMGCLIVEGYGLTECAPTLTLNRPDNYRLDAVGKALPSVELRIAEDGEIQARGPNVFSGYFKDEEATAAAFTEDGWFRTGDLGTLDEDGFLRIIGRKKEIIVTAGGKNIPPANVEMLFQDDPFIEHLVVYGDGKKYLVAGIWPNLSNLKSVCESGLDDEKIQSLLQSRVDQANAELARFESIKAFAVMDEPLTVEGELLTSSLKIRRKKIYERFKDTFENLYGAKR